MSNKPKLPIHTDTIKAGYTTIVEDLTYTPFISFDLSTSYLKTFPGSATFRIDSSTNPSGNCCVLLTVTNGPYTITLGIGVSALGSLDVVNGTYIINVSTFGSDTIVQVIPTTDATRPLSAPYFDSNSALVYAGGAYLPTNPNIIIVSAWVKILNLGLLNIFSLDITGAQSFAFGTGSYGNVGIYIENSYPSSYLYAYENTNYLSVDGLWHHLIGKVNATTGEVQIYIDAGTPDIFVHNDDTPFTMRANDVPGVCRFSGSAQVQVAELWVDYDIDIDLSVSTNIEKFRSSAGTRVDLGANGETPTGFVPEFYFNAPGAEFRTNRGYLLDFKVEQDLYAPTYSGDYPA